MIRLEKTFNLLKNPWVIILYVIFVVLAYYFIDRSLATYVCQFNLAGRFPLLIVFTIIGKWYLNVILFLFLGLYFRYIQIHSIYEARAWYLFWCVLVANLVCLFVKVTVSRARPELLFTSHEFGFYWLQLSSQYWSFPSGHATTAFSLAAGLGVLFPRYFYALLVAAVLIALSRILLCRHYLSDVMTGLYLGLLAVGLFTDYLKRKKSNWFNLMISRP